MSGLSIEIQQICEKFPLLTQFDNLYLVGRLGLANSRRRKYLSYHGNSSMPALRSKESNVSTSTAHTTGTESSIQGVELSDRKPSVTQQEDDDELSDTSSRAQPIGDRGDSYIQPPSLFAVSKGALQFICPLCRVGQRNMTEASWRQHMYTDLRPYICTFDGCDLKLQSDVNSWFSHETIHHRSKWRCPLCTTEDFSASQLRSHLRVHGPKATELQIDALAETARRIQYEYSTADCQFCNYWEWDLKIHDNKFAVWGPMPVTPSQYRRHVSSHMRQVALLSIPRK